MIIIWDIIMAWYNDVNNVKLNKAESANAKYNKTFKPGQIPSYAGIYRCQECGYEDVINRECTKIPPCNNCEEKGHGENRWKLLVRAVNAE